jgi:hypothetical protein
MKHLFLIDPVVLGGLPALDFTLVEPESNLLLSRLDGVRAVADVAADVLGRNPCQRDDLERGGGREKTHNGVVTTDGTWLRGQWVGGTEKGTASLDGITALPDHGTDGTAAHVYRQSNQYMCPLPAATCMFRPTHR